MAVLEEASQPVNPQVSELVAISKKTVTGRQKWNTRQKEMTNGYNKPQNNSNTWQPSSPIQSQEFHSTKQFRPQQQNYDNGQKKQYGNQGANGYQKTNTGYQPQNGGYQKQQNGNGYQHYQQNNDFRQGQG